MIEFQAPKCSDKAWADALLACGDERGCEYNFTNLYTWSGAYDQQVARVDDCLVVRLCGRLGCCYAFPVGCGDAIPVVRVLFDEERPCGAPLQLISLTQAHVARLEASFPGQFTFSPDRDGFDYLYDIDRLADLTGKKLHNKRTHINHFLEEHPDWVYEKITRENMDECRAMDREWYRLNRGYEGDESLGAEGIALRLAMDHYEELGLDGGLIRAEGRVVAFTMGDRLCSDTYDVHFEKALAELQGAYALMNREFARAVRAQYPQVRYLNREDDLGVEGLRKAKASYYPDLMVEKYSAIAKQSQSL